MKSFKAMMSEVAQPEPAEEKAFKAQHTVVSDKHPVALETQHKGTKTKAKRKADQEGDANYDLAYESVELDEMKVKNSDAAFKLETEISNLEKRIAKLKPLALKDDDANMKLSIAKKSLKQKQDAHGALMKEAVDLDEGEDKESASPDEASMAMKQADFLAYVGREMKDHLKAGKEFPEWMQNKLSKLNQAAQDLHSNFGAHGEDDMDEALSPKQKKIDHNKNGKIDGQDLAMIRAKKNEGFASDAQRKAIWASKNEKGVKEELKGDQHKIDKNKNGKIDAHDFKLLKKESLDELKQSIFNAYVVEAEKKIVSPFDLKNYKSQIPTKAGEKAGFDSKKVSTGTVYSRKPVKEAAYEKDMDDKKKVVVKGVKGMKSTPFTKTFRNMAAYDKWSDSDAAGDYEVRQVMHEEVEQIDELSKGTLNSYLDKKSDSHATNRNAVDDAMDAVRKHRSNKPKNDAPAKERMAHSHKEAELDKNLYNARKASTSSNVKMLQAKRKLAKEEVEQIDELSKKTLGSYAKKATSSMSGVAASAEVVGALDRDHPLRQKYQDRTAKRVAGVEKAVDRLAKEEVELDEAFKVGIVKLKDNSSMVLKKEDADILNKLMSGMSAGSVKKMTETAMKDKNGFAEILAFAKEAV